MIELKETNLFGGSITVKLPEEFIDVRFGFFKTVLIIPN